MLTLEKLPDPKRYASPLRFLIIIAAAVFMIEAGVMILLIILPPLPEVVAALFDALLLTILIYPILYRYVVRPMNQHIDERRQVEAALRRAHDELELRVQERTEELTIANAELKAEIEERQRLFCRVGPRAVDLCVAADGRHARHVEQLHHQPAGVARASRAFGSYFHAGGD